ncbi:hypothetical protein AXF42_Ash007729 [Apostasia shenzhenica]|uniref:Uncharacterized protein n=1 Tax=Apostasia shenzhenica TaxID=1088818 RepID=A0A2I0B560_9ASPA|nr:hypothetical protein AXF42_Ash007729 [Apostasia shenzhenica]
MRGWLKMLTMRYRLPGARLNLDKGGFRRPVVQDEAPKRPRINFSGSRRAPAEVGCSRGPACAPLRPDSRRRSEGIRIMLPVENTITLVDDEAPPIEARKVLPQVPSLAARVASASAQDQVPPVAISPPAASIAGLVASTASTLPDNGTTGSITQVFAQTIYHCLD